MSVGHPAVEPTMIIVSLVRTSGTRPLLGGSELTRMTPDSTLATRPATSPAGSRVGSMGLSGG
jgi:hypothetical protein